MYPEVTLFGVDFRSHQIIRWSYFLIAALLTAHLSNRRGIGVRRTLGAFLVGIPAALIGGHLLNVFEAWPFYREHPSQILDILSGGSSIYGALAFGVGAGVLYLRWASVAVRPFLDAASPALALGETVSRIGCFLNGCCFGHPTLGPLGITFPRESQVFAAQVAAGLIGPRSASPLPVHATQIYSAVLALGLFLVLLWLFFRRRLFPGASFCLFVGGYAVIRLVVGHWRADAALYWWEVTTPISAVMLVVAGALWVRWRPREPLLAATVEGSPRAGLRGR